MGCQSSENSTSNPWGIKNGGKYMVDRTPIFSSSYSSPAEFLIFPDIAFSQILGASDVSNIVLMDGNTSIIENYVRSGPTHDYFLQSGSGRGDILAFYTDGSYSWHFVATVTTGSCTSKSYSEEYGTLTYNGAGTLTVTPYATTIYVSNCGGTAQPVPSESSWKNSRSYTVYEALFREDSLVGGPPRYNNGFLIEGPWPYFDPMPPGASPVRQYKLQRY